MLQLEFIFSYKKKSEPKAVRFSLRLAEKEDAMDLKNTPLGVVVRQGIKGVRIKGQFGTKKLRKTKTFLPKILDFFRKKVYNKRDN